MRDEHHSDDGNNATGWDDRSGANNATSWDDRLVAALREPSLRAALLALGSGTIWVALSRWRRQRPADRW